MAGLKPVFIAMRYCGAMRVVIATSLVPAGPPESGYEIANAAIAAGFARAGAAVTHLGF